MILGVLIPLAFYLVLLLVFLGLGIGVGYLVNWMLPAIGLGSAVVAGTVANITALYAVFRFLIWDGLRTLDSDDDDPPPQVVYMMDPITRRGSRRKRRKPE